ncbi:hypothetical protein H2200_001287 [Cladophialophora chaetospira]|uniref:SnoaL-like domain-containing protein n=1 Tax=Cladophialophora chaetospira TaxID=386627 RepID=A0AA38XKQ5_9EURO|nr:hypothetical protein H2200_001287 [Cladophialophora chaetospira]
MSKRPALMAVDHPLSYARKEKVAHHRPRTLEEKVQHLLEIQDITDMLNEFTYALDACLADPTTLETYVELLTDDCHLHFPFGSYKGTAGVPQMVLNAESRFSRMMHMTSNLKIIFADTYKTAYGRATISVTNGLHEVHLDPNFVEGGYYYFTFRKNHNTQQWQISYLYLDISWTQGDSRGLNESGAAD